MPDATVRKSFSKRSCVLLFLAFLGVAFIGVMRLTVAHTDYAVVNALTVLVAFLCWLLLSLGLSTSPMPRPLWKIAFLLPIVLGVCFFSLYRVKRFNGELAPQFEYRWVGESTLPIGELAKEITEQRIEKRSTDFAQFRGENRDGSISGIRLIADWGVSPPEIQWKRSIGPGWSGFAIQGDLGVTLEQRDEAEWVTAFDITSGEIAWHYAIPGIHRHAMGGIGPRSTPTIWDNKVYAVSAVSEIVCLDLATGQKHWAVPLLDGPQEEFEKMVVWGRSGSPLVDEGRLIVPVGGTGQSRSSLLALDAHTGEKLRRFGTDQISYSSPLIAELAGVRQLIYTSESKVSGFDLEDATLLWQVPAPGSSGGQANVAQPVVVGANWLLVTKGYGIGGRLWEVTLNDSGGWKTKSVWAKAAVLKTKFTSAVVLDGFAYALSDGILECVEVESGKRMWKRGRYRQGQLLLVGEHLLITSEGGEVVLVDGTPDQFNERGRFQVIGDVSWNTAAISGDRLLMRNADEFACVALPTQVQHSAGSQEALTQQDVL